MYNRIAPIFVHRTQTETEFFCATYATNLSEVSRK